MRDKTSGFLFVNKPAGITSHNVVDHLRKITGIQKIGHAGTLDPFATGLLILGIDREATKKLSFFQKQDKEYLACLRLGAVSDTYDRDGEIAFLQDCSKPTKKQIQKVLQLFKGEIKQIPPLFSAKKIKGKKLYELARKGIRIHPQPQKIKIYQIKLLNYQWPFLNIQVHCSSGTYIRSLASDIGEKLKCGAYLQSLCRLRIGKHHLQKAVPLSQINPENWQQFLQTLDKNSPTKV